MCIRDSGDDAVVADGDIVIRCQGGISLDGSIFTQRDAAFDGAQLFRTCSRDTIFYNGLRLDYAPPQTLKPKIVAQAVNVRQEQLYTAWRRSRTQREFVQLGVFKFVNLTIELFFHLILNCTFQ